MHSQEASKYVDAEKKTHYQQIRKNAVASVEDIIEDGERANKLNQALRIKSNGAHQDLELSVMYDRFCWLGQDFDFYIDTDPKINTLEEVKKLKCLTSIPYR